MKISFGLFASGLVALFLTHVAFASAEDSLSPPVLPLPGKPHDNEIISPPKPVGPNVAVNTINDETMETMQTMDAEEEIAAGIEELAYAVDEMMPDSAGEISLPPMEEMYDNTNGELNGLNLTDFSSEFTFPPEFSSFTNISNIMESINSDVISEEIGSGGCQFCDGSFDGSKQFAGFSCDKWEFFAKYTIADECSILRAAAVQFCGCPTTVEETCELCPHGYGGGFAENDFLFALNGVACSDIVAMPAVDGGFTCSIVERFSYYCECPGTKPTCSLCGDDDKGNPVQMANPDQVLISGDDDSGIPRTTCAGFNKLLSLQPAADEEMAMSVGRVSGEGGPGSAASMMRKSPCEQALASAEQQTGVRVEGICGCPNAKVPDFPCPPCAEGFVLQYDDNECMKLMDVAPFITDAVKCGFLHEGAQTKGCCVEVTMEVHIGGDGESETDKKKRKDTSSATKGPWVFVGAIDMLSALAATVTMFML